MSAILFGSISTVADTSELQRQSFNQAFEAHGLGWRWDQQDYREMLEASGGRGRISAYAESRGESVDAAAVHETKSGLFQENLAAATLTPRAGVVETVKAARSRGWKVGLVTTTSRENVTALLEALAPDMKADDFDVIVDVTDIERPKPDRAAYAFALQALGETPADCVAIEDNIEGVRSASAAGLVCVAFPNENTAEHDFAAADRSVARIDLDELTSLAQAG